MSIQPSNHPHASSSHSSFREPLTPRSSSHCLSDLGTNKKRKLDHPTSKLQNTLASLTQSTNQSLFETEMAKQQLNSLCSAQNTLERENRTLQSEFTKERMAHALAKKDLKISQESVRRLRKECEVFQQRNTELKSDIWGERDKVDKANRKLENEMRDHLRTSQALTYASKQEEQWKERIGLKSIKVEKLMKNERDISALEKENKALLRKLVALEDQVKECKDRREDMGILDKLRTSLEEDDSLEEEEEEIEMST